MAITKVPFNSIYGSGEIEESYVSITMPGAPADAKRICRFIHISDLHIATFRPEDPEEEKKTAIDNTKFWTQFKFFVAQDGEGKKKTLTPLESTEVIAERIRALSPDAVFLTGDTVDFPSVTNFMKAKEFMDALDSKCFMAPGNHDRIENGADQALADAFTLAVGTNADFAVDTVFGIDIVRIDDGLGTVTREQVEKLRLQLENGRPTIVLLHAPVMTESVVVPAMGMWGDDLSKWVIGFNKENKENVEFLELLNSNRDHVLSVFAGHVHLITGGGEGKDSGEGFSPDEVLQYTANPTFMGFLRVIDILS